MNSNLKESVTRATLHCYYEFVLEAAMNVLLVNLDFGVEPRQLFNLKDNILYISRSEKHRVIFFEEKSGKVMSQESNKL